MTDSLLTAADVANTLNLNTETGYRLVAEEGLPASKIGGQWRFQKPKVLAWSMRKPQTPFPEAPHEKAYADERKRP